MHSLGDRSLRTLEGVHPDLVAVVLRAAAIGSILFIVTEGRRTRARQEHLVATGKSRTMNSRHLTGHAVDLAVMLSDGTVSWEHAAYRFLAITVKAAARDLEIPLDWGGDCFGPSFFDGPHFQLPWAQYPVELSSPTGATNAA